MMGRKPLPAIYRLFYLLLFMALSLSLIGGCGLCIKKSSLTDHKSFKPPENILLITIDTLRADHLGCYGYPKIHTPNIDSLAGQGVRFEKSYTPVPITLPSHASIMTGLYPYTHGVINNGEYKLDPSINTLAQVLKKEGFTTAAFVGAFVLSRQFGLSRGFDIYDDELSSTAEQPSLNPSHQAASDAFSLYNERKAEDVNAKALRWLKEKKTDRFFLWVHYFDPHFPYDPPEPFKSKYKDQPYNGEIAYIDYCLGLLFQEIKKQNLWQDTLIIFTADHGESLGEHQESTHGIFLYEPTVRVPLIMHYAGLPSGVVSKTPVKSIDIMPTIMDILKTSAPKTQGNSLITYLNQGDSCSSNKINILLETKFPEVNFGWSPLQGLCQGTWKYIQAPRPELYDLAKDPGELNNVATLYPSQARKMEKNLEKFLKKLRKLKKIEKLPENQAKPTKAQDRITQERLQGLGYLKTIGSSASADHSLDPKDMIAVLNLFDQASAQYVNGEYQQAISSFREVVKQNPQNILAFFLLAASLEKTGQLEEAIKTFQKVADLDEQFINVHNNLGNIYERLGKYGQATEEYKKDIRLHPEVPLSYNNLGVIYLKENKYEEARQQFERVLSCDPDRPTQVVVHTNLAIACEMLGSYEQAQQEYQKSLKLDHTYFAAHLGSGNVFFKTRQPELAIKEWKKTLEINPQNIEAHFNLGCTFMSLKKFPEAIDHLQETVRLEPNLWQARMLLEQLLKVSDRGKPF